MTQKYRERKHSWLIVVLILFACFVFGYIFYQTLLRGYAFAEEYTETDTSTINVKIKNALEMSLSESDIALHPQVGVDSGFASGSTVVSVNTNSTYGYTLQISATSDTTALTHQTNSSITLPTLADRVTLTDFKSSSSYNNYWGFTHDNTALLTSGTYLPIPKYSTPETIKETSAASTSSETTVTFGVKIDGTAAAGTYQNTVVFTAIANHAPLPTMQNFTAAECSALSTGETTTRTDSRDNRDYTIGKLADGKCWMLSNLRLAPGTTITSENSNITASTYTVPSTWSDSTTTPYAHAANNDVDGVYYNWHAATALLANDDSTSPETSLCPLNWSLPDQSVFTLLANAYSSYTDFDDAFNNAYSGYVTSGTVNENGTVGDWWSSSVNTSSTSLSYILRVKNGKITTSSAVSKRGGRPIRCYFSGS